MGKETNKPIEKTRMRTSMKAVISLKELKEITSSKAYMPPMSDEDLIKPEEFQVIVKEYNEKEKKPRTEGEGGERRGRGRRGRRGRGRGRNNRRRNDDYERSRSRDDYERRRRR